MIQRILKSLIFIASLQGVLVQAQQFLEPCTTYDFSRKYEERVASLTQGAMPGKYEFGVMVIPSFTPEWGVGISKEKESIFLSYVVLNKSLWGASWVKAGSNLKQMDFSTIEILPKKVTVQINQAIYDGLRAEWERSISSNRASQFGGLDGTTYNFKLLGQCGKAWSPKPETRNGKLVELVNELQKLASTTEDGELTTREVHVADILHELSAP
ncbi:MAG TPA: hypothetical protein VMH83_12485 [Candidatus Acidoferrum sp.]|nr:hypothetical protein [Candidatus Acidoferrum sp.]